MKKIILILLLLTDVCFASVSNEFPELNSVSCKFKQQKILPSRTLLSGGNFQFIKGKGVIFDTVYPVQMRTTYADNRQINDIILAISQKNYSYIEKNFDVIFSKSQNWNFVLKPKTRQIKEHLNSIEIVGNKYIQRIIINTVNNGKTDISFFNCGNLQ